MDDLERLIACHEIQQLAHRYSLCVDSRDIDALVGLFVGNDIIDFGDEDRARGVVYCKGEIQDGDRWIHQAIQYRDAYERREGHWRFWAQGDDSR